MINLHLPNEQTTLYLGKCIAEVCENLSTGTVTIIYLNGEVGTGKTTLSRGFLQALGHRGNIKSPTYTLVEQYKFNKFIVYHLDFYRIIYPEELEFIGIMDILTYNAICLVEWPKIGAGILPSPDIEINLFYNIQEQGRDAQINTIYSSLYSELNAVNQFNLRSVRK